ncbi:MAG: calcium/sodium antiporter [bacterium]|nr:calcium/sodium antiporter [bacterium]
MTVLLFVLGLVALILGAEVLVRGASRLTAIVRIPPLVIGLTVVAFGTSAPELAVSVQSTLNGQGDLALGNVVGSNIFNVLFILGLSALIAPLTVARQLVRLDVPLLIGISTLTLLMSLDGKLGRPEGVVLFLGIVVYTLWSIRQARKDEDQKSDASENQPHRISIQVVWIILGLGLLVMGSRWLVESAVVFARLLGVSELVIGLTIVAVGTSLPEVVTSIVASIRGERDIAVGNVVGSNIFNLLAVLGLSSALSLHGIDVPDSTLYFDLPIMLAVAVACLPVFFTGHRIARWEGALFLGYYAAYTTILVLIALQSGTLPHIQTAMLFFVIPLTLITLLVSLTRSIRSSSM